MKKQSLKQRVLCDFLGWHSVGQECGDFTGPMILVQGYCVRCGRRCLQDSNGDWFDVPERNADMKPASRED